MKTPILLITFNRPTHTKRVLERILEANPKDLYIFQDGAREGNATDVQKCQAVRDVIDELTVHCASCTVHRNYSDVNLGCGPGPATGISWFFDNIEQGMIFEDDCLPSSTIFAFYEELLNRYKNDERISIITGTNALSRWRSHSHDYIFAKSGGMTMGCWASWRRAWQWFDWEVKSWGEQSTQEHLRQVVGDKHYADWKVLMDKLYANPPQDAWDYQWSYARTLHNSLSIVSTVNQMSNIGFCEESTHTPNANDRRGYMKTFECRLPLKEEPMKVDKLFDWEMHQRFGRKTKKSKILKLVLKLIDFIYRR